MMIPFAPPLLTILLALVYSSNTPQAQGRINNNNNNNLHTHTASHLDSSPPAHTNGILNGLSPAVIKGYKFFHEATGTNILIKGVDYYPRPNEGPLNQNSVDYFTLEHKHIWQRDIVQFKALGINAIRLYAVDPDKDHSAFMCALNKAGIYVMVELASGACPTCAITRDQAPDCYPKELKLRGQRVIREFSKYTNTLAFSAGNEVNHFVPNGAGPQWNAPCLKKFLRDMRAFVRHCHNASHMRPVPIGLIMADTDRKVNTLYYNCQSGHDDLDHAEWYGINTYVYCNASATHFDESVGFTALQESFESYNYSIPVLLTEFGCLSQTFPTIDGYQAQRTFHQAQWFDLPQIQDDFAGGFVFEYSLEKAIAQTPYPFREFGEANYGIGYLSPEQCDDVTIMCEYNRTPAFYNLKKAFAHAKHNPTVTLENFEPQPGRTGRSTCPPEFPPIDSFHWKPDMEFSISCPSVEQSQWTCPKEEEEQGKGGGDASFDSTTTETTTAPFGATSLFPFLLFAVIIGFIVALTKQNPVFEGAGANRSSRTGEDDPLGCFKWKRQQEQSEENDLLIGKVESTYKTLD